jgi:hypothetical protein
VSAEPELLRSAWIDLVMGELLGFPARAVTDGAALPTVLQGPDLPGEVRPDAVVCGPPPAAGRAAGTAPIVAPSAPVSGGLTGPLGRPVRMLVFRRPWGEAPTKATAGALSPAESAAGTCRRLGVPLALLTDGRFFVLVHARPAEPATTAVFDADLWLEERPLLRAFASLLAPARVLRPPSADDEPGVAGLAELFARTAAAQTEVTDTLGGQVRAAVELLVTELSRLDRESGGRLLADAEPKAVYLSALTVMMRLVFLLYAEEQRLLPVTDPVYAAGYAVGPLFDSLEAEQQLFGEEVGDRRAAAWPRLFATFTAIHRGCTHPDLRIPAYGGALFDPGRYPWLTRSAVSDRVVHKILDALLVLRRRARGGHTVERLSYKGLDVTQIGHVYEGLLEYSCARVDEPHVGLDGKLAAEVTVSALRTAASHGHNALVGWLAEHSGNSAKAVEKALATSPDLRELAALHAACDNEAVREAYALDEEREPAIRAFEAKVASAPLPSWREIDLGHGFHQTRQGIRFTVSPQAHADVLDKLLALNHYRYDQEFKQGLHSKKTSRKPTRAATTATTTTAPTTPATIATAEFPASTPAPGTLF